MVPARGNELRLEEALLATIPKDVTTVGEPQVAPDGTVHELILPITFCPNGTQVVYLGMRDGKIHPVFGEKLGDAVDYYSAPLIGPAGDVALRVGRRKGKDREVWHILLGEKKIGPEDWIGSVAMNPAGDRLAYWTQPGAKVQAGGMYSRGSQIFVVATKDTKGKWRVKKGKKYQDARSLAVPVFSGDGETVVTLAHKSSKWHALTVGSRGESLSKAGYLFLYDVALSGDGKKLAFSSKDKVYCGSQEYGKGFDRVGMPVFSADGKRLVCKVLTGEKMGLAINGKALYQPTFDYLFRPAFSAAGDQLAYAVNTGGEVFSDFKLHSDGDHNLKGGKCAVVRHAAQGKIKPEPGATYDKIANITFSPDGKHLAYVAKKADGWTLVIDGEEGPLFDLIGPPQFSDDSQNVAHGARISKELWWKVRQL
jgi:hypothetical protein